MSGKKPNLTPEEIAAPFAGAWGEQFPPIISRPQVAKLFGKSVKAIDDWKAKGRLDGTFRKRGKHLFFWRDRVIDLIYNGKDWK
jgi:hypothetical protein